MSEDTTTAKRGLSLSWVWGIRLRFRAEGLRLRAEGDRLQAEGLRLRAEGDRLQAEGDKLWAEGLRLRAEGDKLWAEGAKLWAEAILEVHGNVEIAWTWVPAKNEYRCEVAGEVFEP